MHRLLPQAAPFEVLGALRSGRSHNAWVVRSSLGRLTVKIGHGVTDGVPSARLAEHARLWKHGIAVPRLLAWGSVAEHLVAVTEYLPGIDAAEALKVQGDRGIAEAMRAVGAAIAQLHGVPVTGFGDPVTGLGTGPSRWSDVVGSRIERLRVDYHGDERVGGRLTDDGLTLLAGLANALPANVAAAPAHLDVYLPNILLDQGGAFRALLDLEHVRWVDPVMDFVKPAMWIFDGRPAWAEAFVDGYRSAAGWPQGWPIRIAVATGLELLTGVAYWIQVGDDSMREDYQRRLSHWVRSEGEAHVWLHLMP